MRVSSLAIFFASAISLQTSSVAWAEEEYQDPAEVLPVHISKCYQDAFATIDIIDCINAETEYWDRLLNENYKKAMQSCVEVARDNFEGVEQQEFEAKCKQQLKSTQLTWIKYRDGMSAVQCDLSPDFGGTAQRIGCASAYKEIVKEQALKLGRVY